MALPPRDINKMSAYDKVFMRSTTRASSQGNSMYKSMALSIQDLDNKKQIQRAPSGNQKDDIDRLSYKFKLQQIQKDKKTFLDQYKENVSVRQSRKPNYGSKSPNLSQNSTTNEHPEVIVTIPVRKPQDKPFTSKIIQNDNYLSRTNLVSIMRKSVGRTTQQFLDQSGNLDKLDEYMKLPGVEIVKRSKSVIL